MNSDKSLVELTENANKCAYDSLVSVVIPSYNHAAYIEQCIESVISQDYANMELIIIDDGSKDGSVDVIQAMAAKCQERFTRFEFRVRPNKGLTATMNEGLQWAKGKYFSYISSDDVMLPAKTRLLVEFIAKQSNVAGVFSCAEVIDENMSSISYQKLQTVTVCDFENVLLHGNWLVASSMLVDLNAMKDVGGYDESIYFEDWYMWLKLTHAGFNLMILPNVLVKYRVHADNMSKNIVKMFEGRKQIVEMYKDHPLYPRAMSQIYAATALEYSELSRNESFSYLAASFRYSPKIVFTHNFMYSIVKILTPKSILLLIKRLVR